MVKINFKNKPDTSSPINATNLNKLQENIENGIVEGNKLSENTTGKTGKHLKLFTIDMSSVQYKSNAVLFKLTDTQTSRYDSLYNLFIRKGSDTEGITNAEFKEVSNFRKGYDLLSNLFTVVEDESTVSVYYKVLTEQETPKVKILSYQKYDSETLTISSSVFVDSLPSDKQYKPINDINFIQAGISTNYTTSTTDNEVLNLDRNVYKVGDKLTLENGTIVIGKNINYIKVSAQIGFTTVSSNETSVRHGLAVLKNDTLPIIMMGYLPSNYSNISCAERIIAVGEGDIIKLAARSTVKGSIVNADSANTFILIEAIE